MNTARNLASGRSLKTYHLHSSEPHFISSSFIFHTVPKIKIAESMSGVSADSGDRLLRSGEFADCVIIAGGKEIRSHQKIICSQSNVLKQLCEQGLKKYRTIRLEFTDHDLQTVSRVFLYLYTGDYSDESYPNLGRPKSTALEGKTTAKTSSKQAGITTVQISGVLL